MLKRFLVGLYALGALGFFVLTGLLASGSALSAAATTAISLRPPTAPFQAAMYTDFATGACRHGGEGW